MFFDALKNFGYGTVLTPPSPATSGSSFVLGSGQGAAFPAPASDGPFSAMVAPPGSFQLGSSCEIIRVGARSSDTLSSIARAQEQTAARSIAAGDQVYHAATARTLAQLALFDATLPDGAVSHLYSRLNFMQALGQSNSNLMISRGEKAVLLAGTPVNEIHFVSSTTACTTVLNAWACIFDDSGTILAVSNDRGTGNININTDIVFTLPSTYIPTAFATRYGLGLMVKATSTMPTWEGVATSASNTKLASLPPIVGGVSATISSTPPSVGSSIGTITGGNAFYGYLA